MVDSDLKKRFEACNVLSGVGDAIGYKNGEWEFCRSGRRIHEDLYKMGGLENIKVDSRNWMISDDTVMHLATSEALVSKWESLPELYSKIAQKYVECMRDMAGRAPGLTCSASVQRLRPQVDKGWYIPFNPRGGGCGAAMRAVPIGLLYWKPEEILLLITISIESGRMTHNNPTGYLGAMAVALFVSYAVQKKPLKEWGAGLIVTLEKAWEYIENEGRDVEENRGAWDYFKKSWTDYLSLRGITDGISKPKFPDTYKVSERDKFYKSVSFAGTGGASGHDAPMIAYDALLSAGDSWEELCLRSMLHGGDSDSTGIIAAACWGGMNGYRDVPEGHYKKLEYLDRLKTQGKKLYEKSTK
ncbi:ADP-ribosylhydrolase ARH1-like [Halichondria panicea]|uniref:ADP-ribosylhydrolase ARH1-like n=1 Tax=Halichondria panicea TaxID=6063 RepID=UPI00312B3E21